MKQTSPIRFGSHIEWSAIIKGSHWSPYLTQFSKAQHTEPLRNCCSKKRAWDFGRRDISNFGEAGISSIHLFRWTKLDQFNNLANGKFPVSRSPHIVQALPANKSTVHLGPRLQLMVKVFNHFHYITILRELGRRSCGGTKSTTRRKVLRAPFHSLTRSVSSASFLL